MPLFLLDDLLSTLYLSAFFVFYPFLLNETDTILYWRLQKYSMSIQFKKLEKIAILKGVKIYLGFHWNITVLITYFFIFFIEFSFYFRYGFREPPYLDLALRPCFGGHSLGKYEGTISTVMKHLEKRLKLEFIKVLVCPNMDDEIFPFLHHVPYSLTGMAIRVVEFSSGV